MTDFIKDVTKARLALDCVRAVLEEVQNDIRESFEDEESEEYMDTLLNGGEDLDQVVDEVLIALNVIDDHLQPYTLEQES
jgi:division protein CdvB (Snf7/Vps24/ESCRT-III family)